MKYRVRKVEFVGDKAYLQGHGMEWDDVVVDLPDDEKIVQVRAFGRPTDGFDMEVAVVQVWLMAPEQTADATASATEKGV